jgi:hypothetical protein
MTSRSEAWKYLARVSQRLVTEEWQLSRQRKLLHELEVRGADVSQAQALLSSFEAIHKLRLAKRDRLLELLLGDADPA